MKPNEKKLSSDQLGLQLEDVKKIVLGCAAETPLLSAISDQAAVLAQGKMLRSRLTLYVANATGIASETALRSAAAVELIHAASLLHDDVIDGGTLRRGAPTLWMEKGIPAAILLGDLLLFKALELVQPLNNGKLLELLIKLTGEMVAAETEQELVLRGQQTNWDICTRTARRKTGPLFAFAAAAAASDSAQRDALSEAGYLIGTAYQLSDDILDASGDPEVAGKTLGLDALRKKNTCAQNGRESMFDAVQCVWSLCKESSRVLAAWPGPQSAWDAYLDAELRPAIESNVRCVTSPFSRR
jgi:geranylgeranyl pyrophosphate synthase